MSKPSEEFKSAVEALEIVLDQQDYERLSRYLDMLLEANTRFNLTAITDSSKVWMRHVFDSLTLMPLLTSAGAKRVIDIGAGGGLPGIPLAIVMPDARFALLEATGKKARFLREVAEALELSNVDILNDRAETAGQDRGHHRECYDVAVARAVGPLNVLVELAAPLVRQNGYVLAVKGEKAQQEIAEATIALRELRCEVVAVRRTPTGNIVVLEKVGSTPRIFPRRPGEPKRAPL